MATKTGKNPGPKRKKNQTKKNNQMNSEIRSEVLFWGSLAMIILLFLCNFRSDGVSIIGKFGEFLRGIMFGLFGVMAYAAPVVMFFAFYFGLSNRGNRSALLKLSIGVLLFFLLDVVAAMFAGQPSESGFLSKITTYYQYSSANSAGGGIFGSLLQDGLNTLFGKVGTIILLIVLFIISLVILTEKSIVSYMRKGSQAVLDTALEDADKRREMADRRREEKALRREERAVLAEEMKTSEEAQRRMEKKVSGVLLDTKIAKDTQGVEDMHEITVEEPVDLESLSHILVKGTVDMLEAKEDENHGYGSHLITPCDVNPEPVLTTSEVIPKPVKIKLSEKELDISEDMEKAEKSVPVKYVFPPLSKLKKGDRSNANESSKQLKETALRLQQCLKTFGVNVTITDISQGPAVTRYEMQPEQGVKVSKIVNLADDIKLNLAATDIRIEAPIPGKAAVGIEVPNKENSAVAFRDLLETEEFTSFPSNLAFAVGKDIGGKTVVADIAKMPHLLIAGATGSGKSVCINTLIMSILYKAHPDDVKMIMIDPKVVELSVYNGIPHLMIPVVTDPKKAAGALHWGVAEMTDRYKKFADLNVRDLKGYNKKVSEMTENNGKVLPEKLPQVVIIVDELADLMMVAPGEVEESICRLAQLARAAGIHLIIATQRPSVDVITGLIKANMPSRIAFSVSSGVDSRTILDMNGAEKLLGKGDMLFYPQGYAKPSRVQGSFVSDKEVSDVVDFLKNQCAGTSYSEDIEEKIASISSGNTGSGASTTDSGSERDAYFEEAARFIIEKDKASIGMLQRVFKIGFNRAARIMDQLSDFGIVGEEDGTKPRKVLMSMDEFEQLMEEI